jgi:hypothetical protein
MSTNFTMRLPDVDRAILATLADRVAEDIGVELTQTDLIKLAIKRLPTSPADLFKMRHCRNNAPAGFPGPLTGEGGGHAPLL